MLFVSKVGDVGGFILLFVCKDDPARFISDVIISFFLLIGQFICLYMHRHDSSDESLLFVCDFSHY